MRDIWIRNGRGMGRMVCVVLAAVLICVPVYAEEPKEVRAGERAEEPVKQEQLTAGGLATQSTEERNEAGWRQEDNGWRYYDENGVMKTGWIQAPEAGLWYKMDEEDGSWIRRPALDMEAVVYLLENAIKKMGHYQNEEHPVVVREDWRSGNIINMSVRIVTGPNHDQILNHYEVNRKSGKVKAAVGDNFNLYD